MNDRNTTVVLHLPDERGGGPVSKEENDYLSRLANSVLGKDKKSAAPPQGRPPAAAAPPPSAPPPPSRTQPPTPPDPKTPARPDSRTDNPREVRESRAATPRHAPSAAPPPPPRGSTADIPPSIRRAAGTASAGEWIREVDFRDEEGKFIPGTILVLEDGTMVIYKESNTAKEYDIVYVLKESGRAVPQGMPLANYEVEPVGRLSAGCLDQLVSGGKWERDMIVFHLVKYKDRSHIPDITNSEGLIPGTSQDSTVSSWMIRKPDPVDLHAPAEEKPALTRGRQMVIKFGPNQKWDAVYWGKDELGHVVAHNTHDKWSLMHLDLNRFKDSLTFGDIVAPGVLSKMEKDFSAP